MLLSQRTYWKLRPWLTPGLQNSHITYARALQRLLSNTTAWLDVGCGHEFVPEWAPFEPGALSGQRVVGIDRDLAALREHTGLTSRLAADGEALPFTDGVFDIVTANMVLEHVEHPERLFREVYRVLKPGGTFLGHTPNASGYTTTLTRLGPSPLRVRLAGVLQGRDARDVYPTYYRANTLSEVRALAARAGFEGASIEFVESSPLFANLPPLLVPEMLFIRALRWLSLERWRPCLLTVFRKPLDDAAAGHRPVLQGGSVGGR